MAPRNGSPPGRARLDDDVRAAIDASHLRALSPSAIARLRANASRLRVPARAIIHREGDSSPHVDVVVSGLIRVYVTAPDGRTMTVRSREVVVRALRELRQAVLLETGRDGIVPREPERLLPEAEAGTKVLTGWNEDR